MTKLTRDTLKKLREENNNDGAVTIMVGMGSCGIAAGAQEAYDALVDEVKRAKIDDVVIKKTGCIGLCYSEPSVEVSVPGMPTVLYGKVDGDVARKIVRKHLIDKLLINGHIFDKPASGGK